VAMVRVCLWACLLVVCTAVMDDVSPVELGAGAGVARGGAVQSIEAKVRAMRKPGNHPASSSAVKVAETGLPKVNAPPSNSEIEADLAAVDDMSAHMKGGSLHGKSAQHVAPKVSRATTSKKAAVKSIEAKVRAMRAPTVELGEGAAPDLQTQMQQLNPMQRQIHRAEVDGQTAEEKAAMLVAKLMPKPKKHKPEKKPMAQPKPKTPVEQLQAYNSQAESELKKEINLEKARRMKITKRQKVLDSENAELKTIPSMHQVEVAYEKQVEALKKHPVAFIRRVQKLRREVNGPNWKPPHVDEEVRPVH